MFEDKEILGRIFSTFLIFTGLVPTSSFARTLDQSLSKKLELQWQRYDYARQTLIDRVGCTENTISRLEWEQLVSLPQESQFTQDEISLLMKRQNKIIAQNRKAAVKASKAAAKKWGLDLSQIKQAGKTSQFCAALPKGGMLHIHPSGTLSEQTAKICSKN